MGSVAGSGPCRPTSGPAGDRGQRPGASGRNPGAPCSAAELSYSNNFFSPFATDQWQIREGSGLVLPNTDPSRESLVDNGAGGFRVDEPRLQLEGDALPSVWASNSVADNTCKLIADGPNAGSWSGVGFSLSIIYRFAGPVVSTSPNNYIYSRYESAPGGWALYHVNGSFSFLVKQNASFAVAQRTIGTVADGLWHRLTCRWVQATKVASIKGDNVPIASGGNAGVTPPNVGANLQINGWGTGTNWGNPDMRVAYANFQSNGLDVFDETVTINQDAG